MPPRRPKSPQRRRNSETMAAVMITAVHQNTRARGWIGPDWNSLVPSKSITNARADDLSERLIAATLNVVRRLGRKSMWNRIKSAVTTRRKFLGSAGVATAAVAAPSVVKAQGPISMRFQSTWPSKDIFHEYALDFGKKINDMTGGDLKIEVLPAGAV